MQSLRTHCEHIARNVVITACDIQILVHNCLYVMIINELKRRVKVYARHTSYLYLINVNARDTIISRTLTLYLILGIILGLKSDRNIFFRAIRSQCKQSSAIKLVNVWCIIGGEYVRSSTKTRRFASRSRMHEWSCVKYLYIKDLVRMHKGSLHIISPAGSQMLARRPLRAINNCPAMSTVLPCHSGPRKRTSIFDKFERYSHISRY